MLCLSSSSSQVGSFSTPLYVPPKLMKPTLDVFELPAQKRFCFFVPLPKNTVLKVNLHAPNVPRDSQVGRRFNVSWLELPHLSIATKKRLPSFLVLASM